MTPLIWFDFYWKLRRAEAVAHIFLCTALLFPYEIKELVFLVRQNSASPSCRAASVVYLPPLGDKLCKVEFGFGLCFSGVQQLEQWGSE